MNAADCAPCEGTGVGAVLYSAGIPNEDGSHALYTMTQACSRCHGSGKFPAVPVKAAHRRRYHK